MATDVQTLPLRSDRQRALRTRNGGKRDACGTAGRRPALRSASLRLAVPPASSPAPGARRGRGARRRKCDCSKAIKLPHPLAARTLPRLIPCRAGRSHAPGNSTSPGLRTRNGGKRDACGRPAGGRRYVAQASGLPCRRRPRRLPERGWVAETSRSKCDCSTPMAILHPARRSHAAALRRNVRMRPSARVRAPRGRRHSSTIGPA